LTQILGQIEAKPLVGEDWPATKKFWFGRIGYAPKAQEVCDFHNSDAPIRIVSAPARTSKSFSAAADTFVYTMPTDPPTDSLHWIVGPNYEINKEFHYLWKWLVEKHECHGMKVEKARNNPGNGDCLIVLNHGIDSKSGGSGPTRAIIRGMSSTNERALQGEEVTTATLSEAAEHEGHIYQKYLSTRCWKINLPTTPKQKAGWILKMIEEGEQDRSVGVDSFTFPPHANPTYNHERFKREETKAERRAQLLLGPTATAKDDPYFAEQFLGDWVYYTGRVLPFEPRRHVLSGIPEGIETARRFVSLDYGYEDAAVALFWAVQDNGILVITDEIYERHLHTAAFVEKVLERTDEMGELFSYVVGDPSKPEVARIFRDAGLNVWDRDKNAMRDRAAGYTRLRDILTEGPVEGFPGLYVHERCEKTIAEWKHLRFKDTFANEYANGSLVGADHAADAARYGIMSRPLPRSEEAPRDWLKDHKRKMRERRFKSRNRHSVLGLGRWARTGVSPYGR
jgi:hypothetical protein